MKTKWFPTVPECHKHRVTTAEKPRKSPRTPAKPDAVFLLTVGSFLLTEELFYLQLTKINFSFFAYSWSFFTYSFSFFTYSWSFFAYSGKVYLIRALRDCKQRSLTVSKKAPTVSKKASPRKAPQNPRRDPAEPSERQISSESLAEGCGPRMVTLLSRSETWVPKRGGLKTAGKRQESATFLQRSFFDVAVQFFVCCSTAFGPNDFLIAEKPMLQCSFCSTALRKLQRNFRFRLWHVAGAGFRGVRFRTC